MIGMKAVAQVGIKRVRVPRHGRRRLRVDGVGAPIVDIAAGKGRVQALRAERIAWGMTGAAMRQALDQIGAAIPLFALGRVRLEAVAVQEQQLPSGNHKRRSNGKESWFSRAGACAGSRVIRNA